MTITGKVKFFSDNELNALTTFQFTSALETFASRLFDNSYRDLVVSVGSNDATPEIWEIDFGNERTFDRIHIGNHNIKSGKIEYWNGAAYVDFSPAISWNNNTNKYDYFEFAEVDTQKIKLTLNTTQVVDAEKYVGEIRCFKELITLSNDNNPTNIDPKFVEDARDIEVHGGGNVHIVFGEFGKYQSSVKFKGLEQTEIEFFYNWKVAKDSKYIYPGGGLTTHWEPGFRIQDLYLVNYVNDYAPKLRPLFDIGMDLTVQVREV